MNKLLLLPSLILLVILLSASYGCNSSGSGGTRATLAEVRNALISEFGEEGAFEVTIASFVKGYSLEQVVNAVLEGRLENDGDIHDLGNSAETPDEESIGTVVSTRLGHSVVQVRVEAKIVEIEESYLNGLGVALNLTGLDVPLALKEEGYSTGQIIGIQDMSYVIDSGTRRMPYVLLDNHAVEVVPVQSPQFVLVLPLLASPEPTFTPSPSGDDDDDATPVPTSTPSASGDDDDDSAVPTPTPTPAQAFRGCIDVEEGEYFTAGIGGCGVSSILIENNGDGNLVVGMPAPNGDQLFTEVSGNPNKVESLTANLTILGAAGHECTLQCTDVDKVTLSCFNGSGGSCTENLF